MLLIGELPGLFSELGLTIVMIERAGLQVGQKPLLIGDGLQLGLFEFLPLADQLLLLFGQLLTGGCEFGLCGFLLLPVAGELVLLVGLVAEFAGEQFQTLVELRFQFADTIPLLFERGLRLGAALFQAERNGRVPLVGGGDFQSLVVHGCCALFAGLCGDRPKGSVGR